MYVNISIFWRDPKVAEETLQPILKHRKPLIQCDICSLGQCFLLQLLIADNQAHSYQHNLSGLKRQLNFIWPEAVK